MYQINIKNRAKKKLARISEPHYSALVEAIGLLGANPDNVTLNIDTMSGEPGLRMRVGKWRIVYERDNYLRIISIEKIGPRGDVYK